MMCVKIKIALKSGKYMIRWKYPFKIPRDSLFYAIASLWYGKTLLLTKLTIHSYLIIDVAINIDQDVNLDLVLELFPNN